MDKRGKYSKMFNIFEYVASHESCAYKTKSKGLSMAIGKIHVAGSTHLVKGVQKLIHIVYYDFSKK